MTTRGLIAAPGLEAPVTALPRDLHPAAILRSDGGRRILRFRPPEDRALAAGDLAALERQARARGARRLETQGKIGHDRPAARALRRAGFLEAGQPSVVFGVEVARARHRVARLIEGAAERFPPVGSLTPDLLGPVADILEGERLMDAFELDHRLAQKGPGRIVAADSPAFHDARGLAGFILVGETRDRRSRELVVRWIAPRHRSVPLLNLALIDACLRRADGRDVATAVFCANPDCHADTFVLARTLGAERRGRRIAYARDLA